MLLETPSGAGKRASTRAACYGRPLVSESDRHARRPRSALVLSGGGSRGAYEAGVLSYLFEHVYPRIGDRFEFDVVSGTSVGAIHAAYVAATSDLAGAERSRGLIETWRNLRFETVMRVSWTDFVGIPLRGLGLGRPRSRGGESGAPEARGGLVDVSPLEALVRERIPWRRLRPNLEAGRPSVLCTAVTEVNNGVVRVFLDGPGADTTPWRFDPYVDAVETRITDLHVRASAAIPFLFPAVRIGSCYFVDGGLRLNTPLSPAVRLKARKILVVGLKKPTTKADRSGFCDPDALSRPAFLLGKLLNVMLLDPIDNELRQLEIVNALLEGGRRTFGEDFAERLSPTLRSVRGVGYRAVDPMLLNPSADLGRIAAECYHRSNGNDASRSLIGSLIKRTATFGVPETEADFLSYIYFDRAYTERLIELGREDARAAAGRIEALLAAEDEGSGHPETDAEEAP